MALLFGLVRYARIRRWRRIRDQGVLMTRRILLVSSLVGLAAFGQTLSGDALVKALRQGGYVIVMRHASSPREVPDKKTANPDNTKPERQLDEEGRTTAARFGTAVRDLKIPVGEVLSS